MVVRGGVMRGAESGGLIVGIVDRGGVMEGRV